MSEGKTRIGKTGKTYLGILLFCVVIPWTYFLLVQGFAALVRWGTGNDFKFTGISFGEPKPEVILLGVDIGPVLDNLNDISHWVVIFSVLVTPGLLFWFSVAVVIGKAIKNARNRNNSCLDERHWKEDSLLLGTYMATPAWY